jgi:hypothetical protein
MMTFASNWPLPPGPLLNAGLTHPGPNSTKKEQGYGWES